MFAPVKWRDADGGFEAVGERSVNPLRPVGCRAARGENPCEAVLALLRGAVYDEMLQTIRICARVFGRKNGL